MCFMFIPKIDRRGHFHANEILYIPDTVVDELWKKLTEPYKSFFERQLFSERTFECDIDVLYRTPIVEFEDMSSFTVFCHRVRLLSSYLPTIPIPYVNDPYRSKFDILSKENENEIKSNLNHYLIKVFANRVDSIFNTNLRNGYPKNRTLPPLIPDDKEHSVAMIKHFIIRDFNGDTNLRHLAFSKNVYKYSDKHDTLLKELCNGTANCIIKGIEDEESVHDNINSIYQLKNSKFSILSAISPTTVDICNHSLYTKTRFRTMLFKNGKLVADKRGRLIPSGFLEMQWKLLKRIDSGNADDIWVLVNGFINYIEEDK